MRPVRTVFEQHPPALQLDFIFVCFTGGDGKENGGLRAARVPSQRQQAEAVNAVLDEVQSLEADDFHSNRFREQHHSLRLGDQWNVVSQEWWAKWCGWTGFQSQHIQGKVLLCRWPRLT